MSKEEGLKNELNLKIEECNSLHKELSKRPLKVVCSGELVDTSKHPRFTDIIHSLIINNERFKCVVKLKNQKVQVIPVLEDEQIFTAVVDQKGVKGLGFNSLVEFQSCDVYEIINID